jgi:transcriptional regulator with XRE-family HTH domain
MKLRLKEVRERHLVTQTELAERAGISRAALSCIEQGGDARISTVRRLAEALNVDPSELIANPLTSAVIGQRRG